MPNPDRRIRVPLRLDPSIHAQPEESLRFKPMMDQLRQAAFSKIGSGTRVELASENSNTVLIISKPAEDHLGPLYKEGKSRRGQLIPAADVLIEEFKIDSEGEFDKFKGALAIYEDLALVRTHLGYPEEDEQGNITMVRPKIAGEETNAEPSQNRVATENDLQHFKDLIDQHTEPFDREIFATI